jgi:hypothetical protein
MNCATEFVITTGTWPDNLLVWLGRNGWLPVTATQPGRVGAGHIYRNTQAANRAIDRMRRQRPSDERWTVAGYCTLDEARSDDNPLGIDWPV